MFSCSDNGGQEQTKEKNDKIMPPSQDTVGPGGSNYKYTDVSYYTGGENEQSYYVFYPKKISSPEPVVIFFHGYEAISPNYYINWINHIVKKGAILIFPVYQNLIYSNAAKMYENAITGVVTAYGNLNRNKLIHTDRLIVIGHSLGGIFAVNFALDSEKYNLPEVSGIFSVEPGSGIVNLYRDYSGFKTNVKIVILSADQDLVVGSLSTEYFFENISGPAKGNIVKLFLRSDLRGDRQLLANHLAPLASNEVNTDTLDYNGFWKWSEALISCVSYDSYCDYINGGKNTTNMGKWSDGVDVIKPDVEVK